MDWVLQKWNVWKWKINSRCKHAWKYNIFASSFTLSTGSLWSTMRSPGRLLAPSCAGGCRNTQQVDGVWLQVFQEILGLFPWQLNLRHCALRTGAIGQAVPRNVTTTQLHRKTLPRHLDVCGAAAGEAELWSPEGNCGQTGNKMKLEMITTSTHTTSSLKG